jgi:hypothetical protein
MTGTRDFSPIGDTTPEDRRLPFDYCTGSDQFLVRFKDGDHMIFSGRGPLAARSDRAFQQLICSSSTAFWDAYLKQDSNARMWLAGEGFKQELGQDGTFEEELVGAR